VTWCFALILVLRRLALPFTGRGSSEVVDSFFTFLTIGKEYLAEPAIGVGSAVHFRRRFRVSKA
jgi:hypothetical protein